MPYDTTPQKSSVQKEETDDPATPTADPRKATPPAGQEGDQNILERSGRQNSGRPVEHPKGRGTPSQKLKDLEEWKGDPTENNYEKHQHPRKRTGMRNQRTEHTRPETASNAEHKKSEVTTGRAPATRTTGVHTIHTGSRHSSQ
ncbi:hypothetical protein NDU88_007809 [Pleurodeles waltl]|uniref:Uncharacterized protein n=1 Tax=Pleurodeles waltl TaxID=8319 RepID=A0AAV7RW57_PLEWA|nr:hypothetical protein NDU88_007809 [Pleurodeles waltl]